MRVELDFVVPCTALHAFCEAADKLVGGCTVDRSERTGEWLMPDGMACVEPVRLVTVGFPVTGLVTGVRGLASAIGLCGEHSMYVRHTGTGLAWVIECSKGR